MTKSIFLSLLLLPLFLTAQITDPKATEVWEPVPKVVAPGQAGQAPSDAIVLFDGSDLQGWRAEDGGAAKWKLADGAMTVVPQTGAIHTVKEFGDCQLHIEWRSPAVVKGEGQLRGNSGIFLQSRYEVQVLDNYGNKTYPNGQAGAVYKQHIPLVNACRKPGEWQSYDIIYQAPRFNQDGHKVASGYLTVLHNGVLIQNHVEIKGTTEYIGLPKNKAHEKAAILLQDHGDLVSYRNIWIREL